MLDAWQTISSFLTPGTLFLLLNLVIATIVLSSRHHHRRHPDPSSSSFAGAYQFPLLRTTSPVLDRLRSFTLHRFRSGDIPIDPLSSSPSPISNPNPVPTESGPNPTVESGAAFGEVTTTPSPPPLARTSSILECLKSINLYRFRSGEIQTEEVKTETTAPAATTTTTEHHFGRSWSEPSRPAEKEKKMKKTASVGGDGGEEVEVRQRRSFRVREAVVEEEVDARADDFINRFKEQLKIQRLNSLLNYKEMLNRGK